MRFIPLKSKKITKLPKTQKTTPSGGPRAILVRARELRLVTNDFLHDSTRSEKKTRRSEKFRVSVATLIYISRG